MCLRRVLETLIRNKRSELGLQISNEKRKALINLNMDIANALSELEAQISAFAPIKTQYTPDQYITALRTHALVLCLAEELIRRESSLSSNNTVISLLSKMFSTVKSGSSANLGNTIVQCKNLLNELGETGSIMFSEGARKYLTAIIESCGSRDLSEEDRYMLGEIIASLIMTSPKPYLTTDEISVSIGIKEKELKKTIKSVSERYPEIFMRDKFVSSKSKLKSWLRTALKEGIGEQEIAFLK